MNKRERIYNKFGGLCAYSGTPLEDDWQIDHICPVIGCTYGGEGYSGLTDGVDVRGKLTEIDIQLDSATILSDKLNMPCAVKLRSLYTL